MYTISTQKFIVIMANLSSSSHQKQSAFSVSLQFVGQSDPLLWQTKTKEDLESSQPARLKQARAVQ